MLTMKKIHYELDNDIAHIMMDDGKANAMDPDFFEEMGRALDRLEGEGAKSLIISGRPGFFSGGLDVKLIPTLSSAAINTLAETLARTILRVFSLPLPTIALCTGHAVAGGAILAFACDLRFALEGPYRIQMNEMVLGVPLPSWVLLIGRSAISVQWFAEAFLHAAAYTPLQVLEKGIFHGVIKSKEEALMFAKAEAKKLKILNLQAYYESKKRLRESDVRDVLELLKGELPFKKEE